MKQPCDFFRPETIERCVDALIGDTLDFLGALGFPKGEARTHVLRSLQRAEAEEARALQADGAAPLSGGGET